MAECVPTILNPGLGRAAPPTAVNPGRAAPATRVHAAHSPGGEGAQGGILQLDRGERLTAGDGAYAVLGRIGEAKRSGEADVFLCERNGHRYTAKVYRREMQFRPELTEALMALDSPCVARLIDVGTIRGRRFEIYPYYPAGSLADGTPGETLSYEKLCTCVIPDVAEGLQALHSAGIVHRDVKPGNMLWRSEKKDGVVLIDFGLASVAETSLTVVVSQVGCTVGYAAPEVSTGVYLDDSDYYSLGIAIYRLFTGRMPFQSAREAISGVITRPGDMPEDLYNLIRGLTYKDISFRSDLDNPNRRWTYPEVQEWLDGGNPPVPGIAFAARPRGPSASDREIPPISFCEQTYADMDALCHAMAVHWERGKQLLMRGTLCSHLSGRQHATDAQRLMALCIEDIMSNDAYTPDQKLLRTIRRLSPEKRYIATPFGAFEDPRALGDAILTRLGSESPHIRDSLTAALCCVLSTPEISDFLRQRAPEAKAALAHAVRVEKLAQSGLWARQGECLAWELGYCLSRRVELDAGLPGGRKLCSVEQLKGYLMQSAGGDFRRLYDACMPFLDGAHRLKPAVYGWMRRFECDLGEFDQWEGRI